ncbi:hypothetical protein ACLOJK_027912 [Asimina triloba]
MTEQSQRPGSSQSGAAVLRWTVNLEKYSYAQTTSKALAGSIDIDKRIPIRKRKIYEKGARELKIWIDPTSEEGKIHRNELKRPQTSAQPIHWCRIQSNPNSEEINVTDTSRNYREIHIRIDEEEKGGGFDQKFKDILRLGD